MMRKIGTNVSSVVTTFYFGLFSVPACFIASMALKEEIAEPVGLKAFFLLVLVGFCGWVAQEGVAKAVGLAPAARMAPINYL